MTTLIYDLRHAARTLRRQPGFFAVVVLTLGFGIGINTATFSIINAVLIRPLGFPDPDRLVAVQERLAGFEFEAGPFSPPDFLDFQREQRSFEAVGAYVQRPGELTGTGPPLRIDASKVTASLFDVLGVPPLLGRTFEEDEDRPGVDVAVLSWRLWQTRYGGDPAILGRAITLDRRPFTVVGVMPRSFEFPSRGPGFNGKPAAVWVPMAFTDRQRQARGNEFNHGVIGRLKSGTSMESARAELAILSERINANYPRVLSNVRFSIRLTAESFHEAISGQVRRPLLLLLAAVGLVLLVTCANVANLVLSRAASRTREIAVRTALGSSRGRLLQLLLAEGAILSIVGALLGLLFSRLVIVAVPAVVTETLPAVQQISLDIRVLAFTAAIAVATSIFFALIPLASVDRSGAGGVLQEEASRTTPGVRRHRIQAGLIVSTVTLAFVLLVGAGLFIRSFSALMATDMGFGGDGVVTASLTLPRDGYKTAASVRAFHQSLFSRTASLPGVRSAALMTDLPLEWYERRTIAPEGVKPVGGAPPSTNLSWVYGPFVETLGLRLKRGRVFSEVESVESRNVVIVNERLARAFWPGQDAIGKRLRWGIDVPQNPNPWLTIVGVVGDVADGPIGTEPFIHAYEPFSQFPDIVLDNIPNSFGRAVKLAVRTDADPRALVAPVGASITSIDSQLAIESLETMDERVREVVAPRRFSVMTLGGFAAGALLLAAIGLYGLLAFIVGERRRELAIRLALGAEPLAIRRLVVGHGLALVGIGLAVGAALSFAIARTVASLLYQTPSHDAVTFGAVPVVLLFVSLVACALPAYRASRVEAASALRAE